jgi:transcriptional regulator with XRE-family HTH domain
MHAGLSPLEPAVAPDASSGGPTQNLGVLIRKERQKRRLTLAEVCARAKISPGFLSLVERGKATPSLGSLAGIADALDLPVSTFLQVGLAADAVTRSQGRALFTVGESGLSYERLSTVFPGQQLDAVKIHIPPQHRAETIAHAGEEWIYVVAGELRLTIAGTPVVLRAGDTCHFRGDSAHAYANRGRTPTVLLWVGTVPVFRPAKAPGDQESQ